MIGFDGQLSDSQITGRISIENGRRNIIRTLTFVAL